MPLRLRRGICHTGAVASDSPRTNNQQALAQPRLELIFSPKLEALKAGGGTSRAPRTDGRGSFGISSSQRSLERNGARMKTSIRMAGFIFLAQALSAQMSVSPADESVVAT